MAGQILDLEKLLRVPYVDPYSGFDISPDGKHVAFAWNRTGQWEIYEMPLDGSAEPRQITSGEGSKLAPHYAPDGRRLAYMLDLDGSEQLDLCVYEFSTGTHTSLTPDEPGSLQTSYDWSPDGAQMAVISDKMGSFDAYLMPASGGAFRPLLSLGRPISEVRWSPDGRWLLVLAEIEGQDFGTYIIPAEGGQPRKIGEADKPLNTRNSRWSPDGRWIAFASDPEGDYQIGLCELDKGGVRWLTASDGDRSQVDWSPDGRYLVYIHSLGETSWLEALDLSHNTTARYQVADGVHYGPQFTPDGQAVVFIFDNPCLPDDLWLLSLGDGALRQLTHSLPAELEGIQLVMPEAVRYPGLDGQSVPALLFRPSSEAYAEGKPPGVVVIHGGPDWLFQFLWYPIFQHMVSRGWVVLAPNYRGSTGYGRLWQLANRYDLGGVDTRDVAAGADYLVQQGLVNPKRIAVTGRSHGGYLTMTCLTSYPDRWAAGSAVVPFLNWFTAHAQVRKDLQHWDIENMGDPEQNHDLWRERSPYFFLDRLQAPVQLICGANDPRCPASESSTAHDRLVELGKAVDFILYPDEGHAFLKIANVIDAEMRRVEFLAQALEG
jgi:dipeptidyl aminopeptidase/acylaminoacyl peptidase